MSRPGKLIPVFCLLSIAMGLLGCSLVPQAIQNLLSEPTSTSTDVPPLPTATSTNTPIPTIAPTMAPPLTISTCKFDSDCPEAVTLEVLLPDGVYYEEVNEFKLPSDQTLWLYTNWIAKDQTHLDENLDHIKWVFTIDDQDYFNEDMLVFGEIDDIDNPGMINPGVWMSVTLSGWEIGVPHYIRYGYYLDQAIDDGWSITEADYSDLITLNVIPSNQPTITPGPTITNTLPPQPAATKAPVIQSTATSSAPLDYNMTLKVTNYCPEAHVVVFNGPMRLKYNVAPGQTVEYQAAQGSYTWVIDNIYNRGPQELDSNVWELSLCQ